MFAIAVCGLSGGGALGMIKELLQSKDLKLSYGNTVVSVRNYIVEYNINLNGVHARLKSVERRVNKISYDILQKKKTYVRKPLIFDKWFYAVYKKGGFRIIVLKLIIGVQGVENAKLFVRLITLIFKMENPNFSIIVSIVLLVFTGVLLWRLSLSTKPLIVTDTTIPILQ